MAKLAVKLDHGLFRVETVKLGQKTPPLDACIDMASEESRQLNLGVDRGDGQRQFKAVMTKKRNCFAWQFRRFLWPPI